MKHFGVFDTKDRWYDAFCVVLVDTEKIIIKFVDSFETEEEAVAVAEDFNKGLHAFLSKEEKDFSEAQAKGEKSRSHEEASKEGVEGCVESETNRTGNGA